jgi:hypothetical protein
VARRAAPNSRGAACAGRRRRGCASGRCDAQPLRRGFAPAELPGRGGLAAVRRSRRGAAAAAERRCAVRGRARRVRAAGSWRRCRGCARAWTLLAAHADSLPGCRPLRAPRARVGQQGGGAGRAACAVSIGRAAGRASFSGRRGARLRGGARQTLGQALSRPPGRVGLHAPHHAAPWAPRPRLARAPAAAARPPPPPAAPPSPPRHLRPNALRPSPLPRPRLHPHPLASGVRHAQTPGGAAAPPRPPGWRRRRPRAHGGRPRKAVRRGRAGPRACGVVRQQARHALPHCRRAGRRRKGVPPAAAEAQRERTARSARRVCACCGCATMPPRSGAPGTLQTLPLARFAPAPAPHSTPARAGKNCRPPATAPRRPRGRRARAMASVRRFTLIWLAAAGEARRARAPRACTPRNARAAWRPGPAAAASDAALRPPSSPLPHPSRSGRGRGARGGARRGGTRVQRAARR